MKIPNVVLALLILGSASARAQSLGAAAQKEKDKRTSKGTGANPTPVSEAKVYTGDDLATYGTSSGSSGGSSGDPGSWVEREKAARAALDRAMDVWREAGKAREAVGSPPQGRDAQDRYDRNVRDAQRRYKDAEEAIAAARRALDAVHEEAKQQQPPADGTPTIRLPLKAKGEGGPGITPEERNWRDMVASARATVAQAEEKVEAAEKAQADLVGDRRSRGAPAAEASLGAERKRVAEAAVRSAREHLAKAEASLERTLENARRQGFDLR